MCQNCWFHQVRAKSTENKLYIASGHPEWSPIMWREVDRIVGAGPQLVEKIMAALGLAVEVRYEGGWEEVQAKTRSGEVDLLVAAYKTPSRELYMDYSAAYTIDPICLIILAEEKFPYARWDDLIGKKGVATLGDSYGQDLDRFIEENLDVRWVASVDKALALLKEEADYFLYALYAGEKVLQNPLYKGKYRILAENIAAENFYITISKQSDLTRYLPKINELIETYREDGTIERLVAEYKG